MNLVKQKAKSNKKEVSKDEAEKILKQSQNQDLNLENEVKKYSKKKVETKKKEVKKTTPKTKSLPKKTKKLAKSNLKLYKYYESTL